MRVRLPVSVAVVILPGRIRQIGYVVTDLDAAFASWVALGVGPWTVIRGVPQRVTYRGRPCEITLSLALANSGDLQVELIHQHDDTASVFTEFLAARGPGFHQLAYWTEDFEETMRKIADVGWPVVWSGGEDLGTRFAYVEQPDGPAAVIEIMELTETTKGMDTFLRDAAAGWDGSDPIRELSL
ncbi:VOC family protein [Mycobacterium sp. 236(2023)]|uniref:VOC family protein n=1 Tax=Mycobacterium sp. 236(2023) TaxID=3038163 RepID=UPI00241504EF|nr:VOC family protein [Mycobacterium sp. 236(2023)]MDG4667870.1 VOC family protein [Mycobacterium sp. 236(2023)]